jgi:carbamoylphosphate synthase large subunit
MITRGDKILVVGAGPSNLGHGTEFDYVATRACAAFASKGISVVVVDSNATTASTEPRRAVRVYLEPLDVSTVRAVIERERPQAIFAGAAGELGRGIVRGLFEDGTLHRANVELLGPVRMHLPVPHQTDLGAHGDADRTLAFEILVEGPNRSATVLSMERVSEDGPWDDGQWSSPPVHTPPHELLELEALARRVAEASGIGAVRVQVRASKVPAAARVVAIEPFACSTLATAAIVTGHPLADMAARLLVGDSIDAFALAPPSATVSISRVPRLHTGKRVSPTSPLVIGQSVALGATPSEAQARALRGFAIDGAPAAKPAPSRPRDPASNAVLVVASPAHSIADGREADVSVAAATAALVALGKRPVVLHANPGVAAAFVPACDAHVGPVDAESIAEVAARESATVVLAFGGPRATGLGPILRGAGYDVKGLARPIVDADIARAANAANVARPRQAHVSSAPEAHAVAEGFGFPVVIDRGDTAAKDIAFEPADLAHLFRDASPAHARIIEFLPDSVKVEVDGVADGTRCLVGGVMQHVERAGVHSADSTTVLPPHAITPDIAIAVEEHARIVVHELGIVGPFNVQFAVRGTSIFLLDVHPWASRTFPLVGRATGIDLAAVGVRVLLGETLDSMGVLDAPLPRYVVVKECVFPFRHLADADTLLGPKRQSTGEAVGVAETFARAYAKALAGIGLPVGLGGFDGTRTRRNVLLNVAGEDLRAVTGLGRRLRAMGHELVATPATFEALGRARVPSVVVADDGPEVVDLLRSGTVAIVVNTSRGPNDARSNSLIRREALLSHVPYFTTMPLALAGCAALEEGGRVDVCSLQEWLER